MKTIKICELVEIAQPGDILLTSNPNELGTVIRYFQELQGDPAIYTHVAIITSGTKQIISTYCGKFNPKIILSYCGKVNPKILEANGTLDYKPLSQYVGKRILLIRHAGMTPEKYEQGFNAIIEDIGKKYPYYRLILHAIDNFSNRILRMFHMKPLVHISSLSKFKTYVCSEWAAKFISCCHLFIRKIMGANPDDFHDWNQQYPTEWKTVFEGSLKA